MPIKLGFGFFDDFLSNFSPIFLEGLLQKINVRTQYPSQKRSF